MAYIGVNNGNGWEDAPSTATPVSASNLNIMEEGIADNALQLADISSQAIDTNSAQLGEEVLDGTGWISDGWTGDFATGFVHTTGNISNLTRSIGATGTKLYQVEFDSTVEITDTNLFVSVGNSASFTLYRGSVTH